MYYIKTGVYTISYKAQSMAYVMQYILVTSEVKMNKTLYVKSTISTSKIRELRALGYTLIFVLN